MKSLYFIGHLIRRGKKGQMAILIALLFQVLFVFFAMSINIALMVHDKINLQNAVDLAAYYAAQKQAEILNVISHQNYQIRRAWKLLVWRYRVTGSVGLVNHPVRNPSAHLTDQLFSTGFPTICINNKFNSGSSQDENLCKTENFTIPSLPTIPIISPISINFQLQALRNEAEDRISQRCEDLGAYNWWFALNIFNSYRFEQAERKGLIRALAQNLQGGSDFFDLKKESVFEGAKKVFMKNLSYSNATAFENDAAPDRFQLFNSLSQYSKSWKSWLPEIHIWPVLLYSNPDTLAGCNIGVSNILETPNRGYAKVDSPLFNQLIQLAGRISGTDLPLQMTLGVEKNPWILAYVGIKAKTKPRQLFWPLGPRLTLTAKAFAKPFGGRIGPWHSKDWSKGAKHSHGSKVDALLPPRFSGGSGGGATVATGSSGLDKTRFPNYSRHPGDQLGLSSRIGLIGMADVGWWNSDFNFKLSYFNEIVAYDPSSTVPFDRLAWDSVLSKAPSYRQYEMAAISPDIFDAVHYSIALNGDVYYWNLKNYWTGISKSFIKPDLGYRAGSTMTPASMSIKNQILKLINASGSAFRRNGQAYWFIKKPQHLLTSWTSSDQALEFSLFPGNRFGQCGLFDDLDSSYPRIANSCVAKGGRSGYSVKLVSGDFLRSSEILNPPPSDF